MVSAINLSLSTNGILSRSTGGGRKGFSSPSTGLGFGAIFATVPAINNMLVGSTGCGGRRRESNGGKIGKFSGAMDDSGARDE
jgi:hypothetical protein